MCKDYEPCGDCGYDHAYETEEARQWHINNPCSYCDYKNNTHGNNCPIKNCK